LEHTLECKINIKKGDQMFYDLAGLVGFIAEIIFDPIVWAAIVLWIMYAKRRTRVLKKWAIVCTVIVVVVHLVLIPLSRYLTGYYQGESTQETSTVNTSSATTQNTESAIATSTTVDNSEQAEMDDYKTNLEEYIKYIDDLKDVTIEINEDISDLADKATETNNKQEVLVYLKLEKDKYEEVINSLSRIFVPEISKELHSYLVDYYTFKKQWVSFMINSISGTPGSQSEEEISNAKTESLQDDARNAFTKSMQELERIQNNLNNKAEGLGLPIPFPEQ
jgi:hypothetical protein